MTLLSQSFKQRMLKVHGQAGQIWLDNFTQIRTRYLDQWSLKESSPLSDLSYNYIEFVITDSNTQAVLKMGVPNRELSTEIQALKHFGGVDAVQLLASDEKEGVLLLERILPGDNLLSINEEKYRTRIAGDVMKNLWQPPPPGDLFPTIKDWCLAFKRYRSRFPGLSGPLPSDLIDRADNLAGDLLKSAPDSYLLHGDLHHMNILRGNQNAWIIIDPKGVIGEAAFEAGPLMINPYSELSQYPNLDQILRNRLDILEDVLGLDRFRLAAWSFIRSVLANVWTVEDGEDLSNRWTQIARSIERFVK